MPAPTLSTEQNGHRPNNSVSKAKENRMSLRLSAGERGAESTTQHHSHDNIDEPRLRLQAAEMAKMLGSRFLRAAREKSGLSQEELAKRVGRAKGYVSQTESLKSDKKVPLNYLIEVALVTNTPVFIGDPAELHQTPEQLRMARLSIEAEMASR